jgi:hypothetical protein
MKSQEIEKTAKLVSAALSKASQSIAVLIEQVRVQDQDSEKQKLRDEEKVQPEPPDAWFFDLKPEQKSKLKRFHRSGQDKIGMAVVDAILRMKNEASDREYRAVIQQFNEDFSSTKSSEKRAVALARIPLRYRELSLKNKKAHLFFKMVPGLKNPIPENSFSPHIGY